MTNLFDFLSYQEYLKRVILDNKAIRGFQTKMAVAANCQTSYLSQVLKCEKELTPDHGIKISQFLKLSVPQTRYLLCLVSYSRAGSVELKDFIVKQMNEIKEIAVSSRDM